MSRERPESVAYEAVNTTDYTLSILTAFTNELPQDGVSNLQKDILECSDNGTLISVI